MPKQNSVDIEQAFELFYPLIFRYFRYRGLDVDTANDLASSVYERALINLHRFDPQKAQIKTWLFTIAQNLAINHWKAKSTRTFIDLNEEFPTDSTNALPENVIVFNETKQEVLNAVQLLEERAVTIIALKFGGNLTNRQIGKLTGLSDSNVGVILYRSMLKLRTLLSDPQEVHDEE